MSKYHDLDGNPIELPLLCQTEPHWAANRITDLTAEIQQLQGIIDAVMDYDSNLIDSLTATTKQTDG